MVQLDERPAEAGLATADRAVSRGHSHPRLRGATSILRAVLVSVDAAAFVLAWAVVALVRGGSLPVLAAGVGAVTIGGLWLLRTFGLYRTAICTFRSVELARLTRACGVLALTVFGLASLVGVELQAVEALIGAALTLVIGSAGRSWYRTWVGGRRRAGEYRRPVLLVGANDEGADLAMLLETHPELGFRLVGVVGSRSEAGRTGLSRLWCTEDDVVTALEQTGATGAIVCATALTPDRLNLTVRQLLKAGAHVQLSSGLRGVEIQRLLPMPLSYEPFFYVEPASLERWQLATKRLLDLVLAVAAAAVTAPIALVVSLLIRVSDRGPVIFRQVRIGQRGQPFTVFKFRTMRVGAEDVDLSTMREFNGREGPLFKATVDPRVTRLGRYLRATGIDELPQLWNVLNGTMSLVGPRPALPEEVAQFDDELRTRESVRPGITGLWQVEARDNPSFEEYRRFDLFYIDNWSVTLDFVILLSTVEQTIARTVRGFRDSKKDLQLAPVSSDEITRHRGSTVHARA